MKQTRCVCLFSSTKDFIKNKAILVWFLLFNLGFEIISGIFKLIKLNKIGDSLLCNSSILIENNKLL